MTRETILKGDVSIMGMDVNKVVEIQDRMDEAMERISKYKQTLTALVFGNPKDLFPDDTYNKLKYEFGSALIEFENAVEDITKLHIINLNENLLVDKYKVDEFKEEITPVKSVTMDVRLANNDSPF